MSAAGLLGVKLVIFLSLIFMYDVSFQDIRELQMTDNPSYGDADDRTAKTAGNNYGDKSRSKWIWWVLIKTLQARYK